MRDRPLQDTIRDQVAAMYMWPKTLEIPVIDDPRYFNMALFTVLALLMFHYGSLSRPWSVGSVLDIRFVCFGSAAKRPVGIIEVKILHAKNLLKKDLLGKADPYVKIQLVKTMLSKTTKTKMGTLNPVWEETFKLLVQDPKSQSLELQVFDWEKV